MDKLTEQRKLPPVTPGDLLAKNVPPHVIAHAESIGGKLLLIAVFTMCMAFFGSPVMPVIVLAVTLASFAPHYRWHITALGTLAIFLIGPFWFGLELPMRVALQEGVADQTNFPLLEYGVGTAFFLFAIAMIFCRRRFMLTPPFSRPILSLLIFYAILVACADWHILHGISQVILWSFIGMFGGYFWFLGYALLNYKETSIPLMLQLGTFHPFWGSSQVPYGKGVANLHQLEAKNSVELAIAQISGVKLIVGCCVLQFILYAFKTAVHSYLGIPTFHEAFVQQLSGTPFPWYNCWFSLITAFLETLLDLTIYGNTFIACARMTGFQLLKNTDKPLQSKTIAEFWNRYYFYFKELLVEFFFYPTFLRCFKRYRRLRIAFATFMAAGVGNAIYHFMKDINWVFELGFLGALQRYQAYLFYCVLLSAGIAISQLRPRQAIQVGFFREKIIPFFNIITFYCLIYIFNDLQGYHTLQQDFVFLLHLFGLA